MFSIQQQTSAMSREIVKTTDNLCQNLGFYTVIWKQTSPLDYITAASEFKELFPFSLRKNVAPTTKTSAQSWTTLHCIRKKASTYKSKAKEDKPVCNYWGFTVDGDLWKMCSLINNKDVYGNCLELKLKSQQIAGYHYPSCNTSREKHLIVFSQSISWVTMTLMCPLLQKVYSRTRLC